MFKSNGFLRFTEEDVFADGCQPETFRNELINIEFKAENVFNLIKKIMNCLEITDRQNVNIHACGKVGRVDFQRMEHEDGSIATKQDIERWKEGEIRLWDANYSTYIEEVSLYDFSQDEEALKEAGFTYQDS